MTRPPLLRTVVLLILVIGTAAAAVPAIACGPDAACPLAMASGCTMPPPGEHAALSAAMACCVAPDAAPPEAPATAPNVRVEIDPSAMTVVAAAVPDLIPPATPYRPVAASPPVDPGPPLFRLHASLLI